MKSAIAKRSMANYTRAHAGVNGLIIGAQKSSAYGFAAPLVYQ
ncbi:MAG: hypothetical protein PVI51_00310 [candidate division WOR-3 bacterium]